MQIRHWYPRKKNRDWLWVFLFLMTLVFSLVGILGFISWPEIKGTYLLPTSSLMTTTGRITASNIYSEKSRYGTSFHYDIHYEYSLDQKMYTADQVTFGPDGFDTPEEAQQHADRYPVGSSVTVFYEQGNPAFAVLEPDVKDFASIPMLLSIFCVFSVIVLFVSVYGVRHRRT